MSEIIWTSFVAICTVLGEFLAPLLRLLLVLPFAVGVDLKTRCRLLFAETSTHYKGKVCWITGASSGIGKQLAVQLASQGADLIVSARNADGLRLVAKEAREINADVEVLELPLDLSELQSLPSVVAVAFGWKDRVDFLFNNGGITGRAPLSDFSIDKKLIEVDFLAQVQLAKHCLGRGVQTAIAKGDKRSFHVINTSSFASRLVSCGRASYSASKAALNFHFAALQTECNALLKSLPRSNEQKENSIKTQNLGTPKFDFHVTQCLPGYIATDLLSRALVPKGTEFPDRLKQKFAANALGTAECAQWMLGGAAAGLDELWIGTREQMLVMYVNHYCPELWRLIWNELGTGVRYFEANEKNDNGCVTTIIERMME